MVSCNLLIEWFYAEQIRKDHLSDAFRRACHAERGRHKAGNNPQDCLEGSHAPSSNGRRREIQEFREDTPVLEGG